VGLRTSGAESPRRPDPAIGEDPASSWDGREAPVGAISSDCPWGTEAPGDVRGSAPDLAASGVGSNSADFLKPPVSSRTEGGAASVASTAVDDKREGDGAKATEGAAAVPSNADDRPAKAVCFKTLFDHPAEFPSKCEAASAADRAKLTDASMTNDRPSPAADANPCEVSTPPVGGSSGDLMWTAVAASCAESTALGEAPTTADTESAAESNHKVLPHGRVGGGPAEG
jgi:hypothetical protein